MAKPYIIPEWGSLPKYDFSLEVMKEGVIIDKIDLSIETMITKNRSYLILGRQPDIVDIALDHASISRQHAILQYRDDGALMLLDFNSAQGTFHNKNQLTAGSYQRLYVGDIIKFGASTRFYIVCGPESEQVEEYDSANMQAYRQKLAKKDKDIQQKLSHDHDSGISWGMGEDAPAEDDHNENSSDNSDDDNRSSSKAKVPWYLRNDEHFDRKYGDTYTADIDEHEISDKDKKSYEKIKKVEKKIQNMQVENKRIYLKENNQGGEFTEGQLAAVTRNDAKIKELIEANDELIHQIRGSKASSSSDVKVLKRQRDDADDDDTYDTTAQTIDATLNWRLKKKKQTSSSSSHHGMIDLISQPGAMIRHHAQALTYEDFIIQHDHLTQQLSHHQHKIDDLQAELSDLMHISSSSNQDDDDVADEVDVVLQKTRVADIRHELQKLNKDKHDLELAVTQVNKLIDISKPALSSLSAVK